MDDSRSRVSTRTCHSFAAIGPNNPLAATTYGFLGSVAAIPLAYMVLVDSAGYDWHGVAGGYAADVGLSLSACLLLGVSLTLLARRQRMKPQRVS